MLFLVSPFVPSFSPSSYGISPALNAAVVSAPGTIASIEIESKPADGEDIATQLHNAVGRVFILYRELAGEVEDSKTPFSPAAVAKIKAKWNAADLLSPANVDAARKRVEEVMAIFTTAESVGPKPVSIATPSSKG